MATFVTNLWESIFTPGTTPTLLLATNVTFLCLQVTLLALTLATYNIHGFVLSVLCAGLWASVNWFAAELQAVRMKEEAEKLAEAERSKDEKTKKRGEDGSDTEVDERVVSDRAEGLRKGQAVAEVEAEETVGEVRKRAEVKNGGSVTPVGTQSSVSTEDEWEKVSESEKEKDK